MPGKGTRTQKAAAILFALALWQAGAMIMDEKLLLVSPVTVIGQLCVLILEKSFWKAVLFSSWRIISGFMLALAAGVSMAVLAGKYRLFEIFMWPYVTVMKAVPVASFIILSLIWLSSRQLSIFISFLMVFPIIYSNVLEGLKATDGKILEMARIYRIPWRRQLLYIYLPQVKPFLFSACSAALGLCWKSGIAAEVIGIPAGSMGEALYQAKIYLDTGELFSWTIVIVLISVLFEKLFLAALRKLFERAGKI